MNYSVENAKEFVSKWLPAWTGNNPMLLVSFYSEDAFYLDPAVPNGIKGKAELTSYFSKLLAKNPDWIWEQIEAIPMLNGFLNKWRVRIPLNEQTLELTGVCLVQLRDGKIYRNEVYFDRTPWLKALKI